MQNTGYHTKRAFAALCLLAGALTAQNTQPSFENDYVIINEPHPLVDVPGYTHKAHKHSDNRVMVYMHEGGEYLHFLADGRTDDLKWHAGEVVWSPQQDWHYSSMKPDVPPFTGPMIVDIGIKKPGDPHKIVSTALDPLKVDPANCKVEIDNDQVRVLRLKVAPGRTFPMHEHALNQFIVYMTDTNVRETTPDGKSEVIQHKSAQFSWSGPSKYKIENLSDKPFEMVIVELKS